MTGDRRQMLGILLHKPNISFLLPQFDIIEPFHPQLRAHYAFLVFEMHAPQAPNNDPTSVNLTS